MFEVPHRVHVFKTYRKLLVMHTLIIFAYAIIRREGLRRAFGTICWRRLYIHNVEKGGIDALKRGLERGRSRDVQVRVADCLGSRLVGSLAVSLDLYPLNAHPRAIIGSRVHR